jgi:Ca2+-binding EF-hand superfamily protein
MKFAQTAAAMFFALTSAAAAQSTGLNEGHLRALDADGDASISMAEFDTFADFAFEEMDVNNDGALSKSEGMTHMDADAFSRADANGNGTVTASEFKSGMRSSFEAADKDGDGLLN